MELEPCPFCGSDRVEYVPTPEQHYEDHEEGFIWCHGCGFSSDVFLDPEIAAEAWNRRASEYAIDKHADNIISHMEELISGLENKPRWIPVTERLPEPNAVDERGFAKAYLVKTDRHVMMHTARWDGMYWILWGKSTTLTDKVTHWMPLPEPPKEE